MLTIFSIPKAFTGRSAAQQRNAVRSWRALSPDIQIILFGRDEGTDEVAREFGAEHVPDIATTEMGTPLLRDAFATAQERARWTTLMYTNADMIYGADLPASVNMLGVFPRFLGCGQRIDLDFEDEPPAHESVFAIASERAKGAGVLHPPAGSDYFIFRRGTIDLPPFVVGRPGWDNWLLYHARAVGMPLLDMTRAVTAIHQNHDYSHSRFGSKTQVRGPERLENIRLAGGYSRMLDLRSSDWEVDTNGPRRKSPVAATFAALRSSALFRFAAGRRRALRDAMST